MIAFDYCIDCQNRYPGCHDQCSEYLSRRICREAELEKEREERRIKGGLYDQRTASVARAKKRHKK